MHPRSLTKIAVLWLASSASLLAAQDNLLIVLADDLGVDMLACYAEGNDLPSTPNIDGLAEGGLLFRNCWANPICSPTRATVLTGRYANRTGLGFIIHENGYDLPLSELILPEALALQSNASWACAAIGKWHLGDFGAVQHPNASGFPHFSGSLHNLHLPGGYYSWTKIENGVVSLETTYATKDTVDDAIEWIANAPEPWMCYVAFNAPHAPYHEPPHGLFSVDLPDVDPRVQPRPFYKAMVEAMDTELGRLLTRVEQLSGPTNVIFLGDNGTPQDVSVPPFLPEHAKLTVYEGGLNVPLIFKGPAVPVAGAECGALVNTTDLFATALDLAGAQLPPAQMPEDSVSMASYLVAPSTASLRTYVHAERFRPNGPAQLARRRRAVREERFKLIRTGRELRDDELYDLLSDRYEDVDLLASTQPNLGAAAVQALGRLRLELDRLDDM